MAEHIADLPRSEAALRWRLQRLTAVITVLLAPFFLPTFFSAAYDSRAAVLALGDRPLFAAIAAMFVISAGYHSYLGLHEIITDYVHHALLKKAAYLAIRLFSWACVCLALFSLFIMLFL